MEEKSRFAQILIFWDAVLLGILIFISLSVKPGLRCLWLHSAMLAECAIGLLILGILTFGKSEPDIVHGRLFTVMIGGISLQLVLYYDQPLILHTFLLILMLTITIYRNFSLCKFAMVEMMVLYLLSVLYYWNVGLGDNVSVMYSVVAAGGVLGGSFILSCILGTEEKNRRIIRENRQTSIDMLRLVEMKKEEAEHLAEVKSVFLANMSHEIRTPMNAVLGMNEMILRESSEEEIVEYAKNIERAGETLMSLINDVLDISKIESGKIEIHPDEYKLETLVDDLMNLVSVKAEEKGLEIRQEFDQDIPGRLYGDELRIKQILINVLNNAIKYTDKGTITFGLSWEQTEPDSMLLKIRVTDTGIGMKEEELKHIFDAFQRLDEKRNQSVEGTGLGMTITKQLIELMGGKISVRSKYGKGTTFYLELPQEILDPAPAQFQRKRKKAEQQYRVSFVAPGVRILAVDDNPMNLAVLRGLLKKTEMQVDLVQSGLEAIAAVQKERYDMILMDHMMPKMDGIETMKQIRCLAGNQNPMAPIIVLTANATAGSQKQYIEEGFDDYLAKPVQSEKLEQMIFEYLPKRMIQKRDMEESKRPEPWNDEKICKELSFYGIDVPAGLCYFNQDMEQYISAAKTFLQHAKEKEQKRKNSLETGDLKGYTIEAHSLKSNGRLLGDEQLGSMAEELEMAGVRGELDVIREKDALLEERVNRITEAIRWLLAYTEQDAEKKAIGQGIPLEEYEKQKQRLAELIEDYEEEEASELILKLQEQGADEKQSEELEKVRQCLEEFAYKDALKYLK